MAYITIIYQEKITPKYQWHVNRAMQNMQGAGDDTGTEMGSNDDTSTIESSSHMSEGG